MKQFFLSVLSVFLASISYCQNLFPYLQTPSTNSIFVNWKTSSNTTPTVLYGLDPMNLSLTTTGSVSQLTEASYAGNYFYNTVQLINLNSNTKYFYKTKSGAEISEIYSFKTLPLAGEAATSDGHIRFLIMGDNQLTEPRYDTLVAAAKRKIHEKWGGDPCDNIAMTMMVGDEVDLGTLDAYENVHFKKNRELSGYLPIMPAVGNHETYGALGLNGYYSHYCLNTISYKGISSNVENYYAIQAGNVLFVTLSTEHTTGINGTNQTTWFQKVIDSANVDNTVDWIITLGHRPYESEQYVGDISTWIKNTVVPYCLNSPKYLLHIGAHHHIYARGQFKDKPAYNMISGGTAWDQYWGMASEQDFDYIQKTISNWIYQIVDVDVTNGKVDVESYSIGSIYGWKNNQLMDSFHRYKNQSGPAQPTITNNFASTNNLPLQLAGSTFFSSANELLNSTEFQISQTSDFSVIEKSRLMDYEDLFGRVPGHNPDTSIDLNLNIDITKLDLPVGSLSNGIHYVRVRYRDRNLEWSAWSNVKDLHISNSFTYSPLVVVDSNYYHTGSSIKASYSGGPGNAQDWIGLYKLNQTPGAGTPSIAWAYTTGASGITTFNYNTNMTSGKYFVAYFQNNGYTEIAPRDTFYYGSIPIITSDTNIYAVGSIVPLYVSNSPAMADSLEVLKVGNTHGINISPFWHKVTNSSETLNVTGLPKGYYTAKYYFQGNEVLGNPFFFQVGDTITHLILDQPVYNLGSNMIATWTDAPGIVKDWLGIYHEGDDPNADPLVIYSYFNGVAFGSQTLTDTLLPTNPGDYYIAMFTNDTYTEVSNKFHFTILDPNAGLDDEIKVDESITIFPNPSTGSTISFIKSKYPIEEITLLDMSGKVVYKTENVNNQQFSLLTQDLPEGQYLIKIQARKLFTYKLIVSK